MHSLTSDNFTLNILNLNGMKIHCLKGYMYITLHEDSTAVITVKCYMATVKPEWNVRTVGYFLRERRSTTFFYLL